MWLSYGFNLGLSDAKVPLTFPLILVSDLKELEVEHGISCEIHTV